VLLSKSWYLSGLRQAEYTCLQDQGNVVYHGAGLLFYVSVPACCLLLLLQVPVLTSREVVQPAR
jgi:hypothetical protein